MTNGVSGVGYCSTIPSPTTIKVVVSDQSQPSDILRTKFVIEGCASDITCVVTRQSSKLINEGNESKSNVSPYYFLSVLNQAVEEIDPMNELTAELRFEGTSPGMLGL